MCFLGGGFRYRETNNVPEREAVGLQSIGMIEDSKNVKMSMNR
jgi:hypothetical protein